MPGKRMSGGKSSRFGLYLIWVAGSRVLTTMDVNLTLFLCRVLAAVPATSPSYLGGRFLGVSMPHPRGGPCDCHGLRICQRDVPRVSMPHPRGGPCDIRRAPSLRRIKSLGFYAASSRRSLRLQETLTMNTNQNPVSMPHPRGGPCDATCRVYRRSNNRFLCRILAAVPATGMLRGTRFERLVFERFYAASSRRSLRPDFVCSAVLVARFVSMPHPRGGPCDKQQRN